MIHAAAVLSAVLLGAPEPSGAPAAAPQVSQAAADAAKLGRGRVLREGSHLVQVRGSIAPPVDGDDSWWTFHVASGGSPLDGQVFALLPSSKLSEMQRMVESIADQEVIFEVTGEVFVFRGRNYLLATHAPLVGLTAEKPSTNSGRAAPAASAGSGAKIETGAPEPEAVHDAQPAHDSAHEIVRDLEQDVGPAVKSAGSAASSAPEPAAPAGPLAKEGTMLLQRRGRMVRQAAGSWLFVFDADAAGLSDPPMPLLPCLMLERMEIAASSPEGAPAMLVSGRVLTHGGRNHLLPTLYRIPTQRTPIKP